MREELDQKTTPIDSVLQELRRTLKITRPLTVLDVETTGTDTKRDRVVEVAFSTVTQSGEVTNRKRLINPEEPIPAEATAIHDISDRDVVGEPTFRQIGRSLAEQLTGQDFVAYNHRFDRDVLTAEFERAGVPSPFVNAIWIDPYKIWLHLEPRKLVNAVERFWGERPDETELHRAEVDVELAAQALVGQLRQHAGTDQVATSVQALAENTTPRDPDWLDAEGKIRWRGGTARLGFGKHLDVPLQEVLESDRNYLEWMAGDRSRFPGDVKTIISLVLQGKMPDAPPR